MKNRQKYWRQMIARGLAFALCAPALLSCAAHPVSGRTEADFVQADDPAAITQTARGANDFAFRFSGALLKAQDTEENFLCSPYSVWLPLAALVSAASDDARAAALEAIGEAGMTPEQLNAAVSGMLYDLTAAGRNASRKEEGLDPYNPLQIANVILVDRKKTLNDDFSGVFARDYGGSVMAVDFTSQEAADTINQWAADHTEGLITEIVESLDPAAAAAIANAIYFSDRWSWEFDRSETRKGTFSSPGGETEADFMIHEGEMAYCEDEEMQAVSLSFTMGGQMLLLLPRDGDPASLLSSFSDGKLSGLQQELTMREGTLRMPRFEIESGIMNLSQSLAALGVPYLSSGDPVITRLVEGEDLAISQAVQNAVIRVDERGTTAAAVTAYALAGSALLPPDIPPFSMDLNHPFAFVLLGQNTGGVAPVLFTGIVCSPAG